MTGQEARDDEREALARLLRNLDFREEDPLAYFYHRADAILAAGYRKHPEPEITEARVEAAWIAYRDAMRDGLDFRPGIRAALEAALRAPVQEIRR